MAHPLPHPCLPSPWFEAPDPALACLPAWHEDPAPPVVWSIAGHDSGGAAGLSADARAAAALGVHLCPGFTGSSIWHATYAFPPTTQAYWDAGFADFGRRFGPILETFEQQDVNFALEVHPTEIAFDIASAERAIAASQRRSISVASRLPPAR